MSSDEFYHFGFPNSERDKFKHHSEETTEYNCIAFALEIQDKWIDPETQDPLDGTKPWWPDKIPRDRTLSTFIKLFELYGFQKCLDKNLEEDYVRIAIFVRGDKVAHAARQIGNGMWVSKLGNGVDCIHSLSAIHNGMYGVVRQFMKKKKS